MDLKSSKRKHGAETKTSKSKRSKISQMEESYQSDTSNYDTPATSVSSASTTSTTGSLIDTDSLSSEYSPSEPSSLSCSSSSTNVSSSMSLTISFSDSSKTSSSISISTNDSDRQRPSKCDRQHSSRYVERRDLSQLLKFSTNTIPTVPRFCGKEDIDYYIETATVYANQFPHLSDKQKTQALRTGITGEARELILGYPDKSVSTVKRLFRVLLSTFKKKSSRLKLNAKEKHVFRSNLMVVIYLLIFMSWTHYYLMSSLAANFSNRIMSIYV